MARSTAAHTQLILIHTVLEPLCEAGAVLHPGLDDREMILAVRRDGVSLARKTVSKREVDYLLGRGWVRRQPPPSRQIMISVAGEQAVLAMNAKSQSSVRAADIETVVETSGQQHQLHRRESPLAWLARRKDATGKAYVSPLQLAAGERFRSDFTLAGLTPRMTVDWTRFGAGTTSGIGQHGHATDVMILARQRIHAALDSLGPDLAGLAMDVCCFLKGLGDVERERGWPQRSARRQVLAALSKLVEHYGFGAEGPKNGLGIVAWTDFDGA